MDANFKAISELETFRGAVAPTDLLVISRQSTSSEPYVTNSVPCGSLTSILASEMSSELLELMSDGVKSQLGELATRDLSDLEQVDFARAKLSSYAKAGAGSSTSLANYHAISAIAWDSDHGVVGVSSLDVSALAESIAQKLLASLNLSKRLSVVSQLSGRGVKLATISGAEAVGEVWSGDVPSLLSASPSMSAGEVLATISYGDSSESVAILNGCDKSRFTAVGQKIGQIGSLDVLNGVEVASKTAVGKTIASISSCGVVTDIRSGVAVEQKATASSGSHIATVADVAIYNGVNMQPLAGQTGQPAFTYNGQVFYNGCGVVDETGKLGKKIATVNGFPVHSGFELEDDEKANATAVVFADGSRHVLRGGVKLGEVKATTSVGREIAQMTVSGGAVVAVRNGVDEEALAQQIAADYDAKLAQLESSFKQQLADLRSYVDSNFLSKTSTSAQNVAGPVSFSKQVTGKIDRAVLADVATQAKWA